VTKGALLNAASVAAMVLTFGPTLPTGMLAYISA